MRESWARGLLFLATGVLVAFVGFRSITGNGPEPVSREGSGILAVVGDKLITEDDIEAARASDFLDLRRQLYDLRAQALEAAIQEELINLEAGDRGIGTSDLIRAYLRDQARNTRATVFLAELEARHFVQRWLEPMRVIVASEGFPSKGPENAPVTIVEFSDFQCPYCRVILPTLEQVEETYGDQVRFVFRQFPLINIHPLAVVAAQASLCANEQGNFWEMHDAMFEHQQALGADQLKVTARGLGLDGADFDECMDTARYAGAVTSDLEAGQALGVRGTPMVFINGRALSGAKPFDEIAEIIEDELRLSKE